MLAQTFPFSDEEVLEIRKMLEFFPFLQDYKDKQIQELKQRILFIEEENEKLNSKLAFYESRKRTIEQLVEYWELY